MTLNHTRKRQITGISAIASGILLIVLVPNILTSLFTAMACLGGIGVAIDREPR